MKELSIEEKAKAYDKIIEEANKMHHENCEACQMCIEELIPELKESDDERIRKALINGFNKLDKSAVWYNGITNAQILAWLEKQGEQKHAEWSEEDEKKLLCICAWIKDYPRIADFTDEMYIVANNYITWLKSLRPQKHWKPSDEHILAINTAINVLGKGTFNGKHLIELRKELKKLREE